MPCRFAKGCLACEVTHRRQRLHPVVSLDRSNDIFPCFSPVAKKFSNFVLEHESFFINCIPIGLAVILENSESKTGWKADFGDGQDKLADLPQLLVS